MEDLFLHEPLGRPIQADEFIDKALEDLGVRVPGQKPELACKREVWWDHLK
jgi:hypothetical protein